MIRSAMARWKASPAIGERAVSTTSGVMSNSLYSFGSSTGNEPCTSPSEMLAAAVASCVSLMVAQELAKAHLKYDDVETEAILTLQEKPSHWEITAIEWQVSCNLPERDAERFEKAAKIAKTRRPSSRALKVPVKFDGPAGAGRGQSTGLRDAAGTPQNGRQATRRMPASRCRNASLTP